MEGTDLAVYRADKTGRRAVPVARSSEKSADEICAQSLCGIVLTFYHILLYNKYNAIVVPQCGRLHLYRRNIIWTRTPALMKNRF